MKPRKPLQQKRRRRLHPDTVQLIKRILGGLVVFSGVALIITGIWYVSRIEALTITNVTVSGGETISHQLVRERVETELAGTYLRLIPKAFALTYPHDAIMATLSGIERIETIAVERTDWKTLAVTFTEYVADSLWCGNETCYFLDETGYAFAPAPSLQGGAFIRFFNDAEPSIGQVYAAPEAYENLNQFITLLAEEGYDASAVTIDAVGDAYVTLTGGGELRIIVSEPAERSFANFTAVVADEAFSDLTPGNFQYVDLRFGDKIFVNRTAVTEEVATSSESGLVEFSIEPDLPATGTPSEIPPVSVVSEEDDSEEVTVAAAATTTEVIESDTEETLATSTLAE